MRVWRIVVILISVLFVPAVNGLCQPATSAPSMPPMFLRGHGSAALFGEGQYLYVLVGGNLLEYKSDTMALVHSVRLNGCMAGGVPGAATGPMSSGRMPPPPLPAQSLWAGGGKVFVLAGPVICVYKSPDLTLEKTVMLPGPPKPPQAVKQK